MLVLEGLENATTLCGLHSAYLIKSAPKQYKEEIAIYYHALKEISNFQDLPEDDFVKLALLVPEEKTDQLLEKLNQVTGQLVQAVFRRFRNSRAKGCKEGTIMNIILTYLTS